MVRGATPLARSHVAPRIGARHRVLQRVSRAWSRAGPAPALPAWYALRRERLGSAGRASSVAHILVEKQAGSNAASTFPTFGIPTMPADRLRPPGKLARSARICRANDKARDPRAAERARRTLVALQPDVHKRIERMLQSDLPIRCSRFRCKWCLVNFSRSRVFGGFFQKQKTALKRLKERLSADRISRAAVP
jgi:hypothetical protein